MWQKILITFWFAFQLTLSSPANPIENSFATCLTEPDSVDPEVECVFPFNFEEVEYFGCIPDQEEKNRRWCSTETDANGTHIAGKKKYGFCSEICPINFVEDELSIASEATNATPDLDVCDFTHCNGMLLTAEINGQTVHIGQCRAANEIGEHFCFVNQDSTCEKSIFPGKSGTTISTLPCKDPRAPKRRFIFTSLILGVGALVGAKAAAGAAATAVVTAGVSGAIIGATT